mmetsp:Transcript_22618/g.21742  ORF Transcript_22618/g.21742 Transcript_22618/m.21742 type:complete len:152 (-) Transcript_22618:209-664(-)
MALTRLQKRGKPVTKTNETPQPSPLKKTVKKRKKIVKVQDYVGGTPEYTTRDAARMVVYHKLTVVEALRATRHPCCKQTLYRHVRIMKQLILDKYEAQMPMMMKAIEDEVEVEKEIVGVPPKICCEWIHCVSPLTMPGCFSDDPWHESSHY